MTRHHCKAIAEILRAYGASYDMVAQFAHYLHTTNPNFDQVQFMHAAGIWGVYQPAETQGGIGIEKEEKSGR
jgi:hypothetical protein